MKNPVSSTKILHLSPPDKIPSILINHSDGEKLIEALDRKEVIVELVWDIPANNVVNMDLWMSPVEKQANDFLKDFKTAAEQLAYNLVVKPRLSEQAVQRITN